MKRGDSGTLVGIAAVTGIVVLWLSPVVALAAQVTGSRGAGRVPEEARLLVVQVISYFEDIEEPEIGAGIIVGTDGRSVYIATAAHVVRRGNTSLRDVRVVFESDRIDSVRARVLPSSRAGLDLAVIGVPRDSARALRAGLPSFDRRGDVRSLRSGAEVSPVGCPQGVCWDAPSPPDRVLGIDRQGILFQSVFVGPGSSGGGLFNEWWEIVGVVIVDEPPRGEAISIDQVLQQVEFWGYPVSLRKAAVPRGGYRTTFGIAPLGPTGSLQEGFPQRRIPSGRVMMTHRVLPAVIWHGGAMRLTSQDLGVTAVMVGAGLNLRKGRFALHPFVEAGFGHVESRFDGGGFFVDDGGVNRYVPAWVPIEQDGLGSGLGLSIETVVAPRTILELVIGHWQFNTPDAAPLSGANEPPVTTVPELPDIFVGAGLRLGL